MKLYRGCVSSYEKNTLILASSSPRRKELLGQLGVAFNIVRANIDEFRDEAEIAGDYVVRLAEQKARAVSDGQSFSDSTLILAADTCIVFTGKVIGKPKDYSDAVEIYRQLSGQVHQVLSAVCLLQVKHNAQDTFQIRLSTTEVEFRQISESEIDYYWRSGEPVDKAGGYGIQGLGAIFIKRINGSYSGVMGLPLYETAEMLANYGVQVLGTPR